MLSLLVFLSACSDKESKKADLEMVKQESLTNEEAKSYEFLTCMYQDSYFPEFLVDKCKNVLLRLCEQIEADKPATLEALYVLTHASTEELNDLQGAFFEHESEIETVARECLAADFDFIARTYGFDPDSEMLIAPREW